MITFITIANSIFYSEEKSAAFKYLAYVDPISLLEFKNAKTLLLVVMITIAVLFNLLVGFMILCQVYFPERKFSRVYVYSSKIFGLVGVLIKHVFYEILLFLALESMECDEASDYECDGGIHYFFIIASFVSIISFFAWIILEIILFVDEHPESKLPWAFQNRTFNFYKLIEKILIALASTISDEGSVLLLAVLVAVLFFGIAGTKELLKQVYMNNTKVLYCLISFEVMSLWVLFVVGLEHFSGVGLGSPVFLALELIVVSLGVICISQKRSGRLLMSVDLQYYKSIEEVEIYSRMFVDMFSKKDQENSIILNGILTIHSVNCDESLCPCHHLKPAVLNLKDELSQCIIKPIVGRVSIRLSSCKKSILSRLSNGMLDKNIEQTKPPSKSVSKETLLIKWIMNEIGKWNDIW